MVLFGWKACPEQYAPVELMRYALEASRAGFDVINTSDHFHPWNEAGQSSFTWTWLGAVAAQMSDSILSTGVICPTMRYHPALIAQAAATVSQFAPLGFWLGVGTGEAISEFPVLSVWPSYTERRARLAEAIPLMRSLLQGEVVDFKGDYYSTSKARLYTLPPRPIPIIVASQAAKSATFAGTYGDGMYTMGGHTDDKPADHYASLIECFAAGARSVGKDPSRLPKVIELIVAYTDDIDAAIQERLKYFSGAYVESQNRSSPALAQADENKERIEKVVRTGCFSSDPEDHIAFAQHYLDVGFDCLIFHYAGPDQTSFITNFTRDVVSKLRQQNSSS